MFVRCRYRFGPLFPPVVLRGGVVPIDLSSGNGLFGHEVYGSMERFTGHIAEYLRSHGAALACGGYRERRDMYARSGVFDSVANDDGPRRIHMGLDFWGSEGTHVLAPI